MIVSGDDALAHRLAAGLRQVYGEEVTLVVPPAHESRRPPEPLAGRGPGRASALFGRVSAVMNRTAATPAGTPAPGADGRPPTPCAPWRHGNSTTSP